MKRRKEKERRKEGMENDARTGTKEWQMKDRKKGRKQVKKGKE